MTSPGFEPGPFSPFKERNLDHFIRWYVRRMRD
ncbi:MAG: hypothetical protein ISS15_09045 [Alphaproteobacteria bacterium]|nr:hypothetical protein [Alphaproteobacteria bacterium]MBL6937022.1 hypothetical protein [Alphaproteobacteria bacterium]MBL7097791.1 hypothetical protein [Alphaproteobacteria bacterium]